MLVERWRVRRVEGCVCINKFAVHYPPRRTSASSHLPHCKCGCSDLTLCSPLVCPHPSCFDHGPSLSRFPISSSLTPLFLLSTFSSRSPCSHIHVLSFFLFPAYTRVQTTLLSLLFPGGIWRGRGMLGREGGRRGREGEAEREDTEGGREGERRAEEKRGQGLTMFEVVDPGPIVVTPLRKLHLPPPFSLVPGKEPVVFVPFRRPFAVSAAFERILSAGPPCIQVQDGVGGVEQ